MKSGLSSDISFKQTAPAAALLFRLVRYTAVRRRRRLIIVPSVDGA